MLASVVLVATVVLILKADPFEVPCCKHSANNVKNGQPGRAGHTPVVVCMLQRRTDPFSKDGKESLPRVGALCSPASGS